MYAKLVFRNAKRSVKDYLVYIVTMTICVTLFYAFLSISSSYYSPDIGSEYDFTLLSDGMKIAICMITLLLLFLIRFVNHYMLRRKQKEFAVQSIMGMEQKTIGRIFFAETLIMGMFSILIGIFCGVFCSQFIFFCGIIFRIHPGLTFFCRHISGIARHRFFICRIFCATATKQQKIQQRRQKVQKQKRRIVVWRYRKL